MKRKFTIFVTDSVRENPLDLYITDVEGDTADAIIAAAKSTYNAEFPAGLHVDAWAENAALLVGVLSVGGGLICWDAEGCQVAELVHMVAQSC